MKLQFIVFVLIRIILELLCISRIGFTDIECRELFNIFDTLTDGLEIYIQYNNYSIICIKHDLKCIRVNFQLCQMKLNKSQTWLSVMN